MTEVGARIYRAGLAEGRRDNGTFRSGLTHWRYAL